MCLVLLLKATTAFGKQFQLSHSHDRTDHLKLLAECYTILPNCLLVAVVSFSARLLVSVCESDFVFDAYLFLFPDCDFLAVDFLCPY